MHKNSELMFREYGAKYVADHLLVLEIGPEAFPSTLQRICNRTGKQWDTLDIKEDPRLIYQTSDPYNYPIKSGSYDVVLSCSVIEHVPRIWTWMRESVRIMKPGGLAIIGAPCSWPYHEAPVDCWRIYPEGMKALVEDAGLSVELSEWGTLEHPKISYALPGRSFEHQPEPYRGQAMKLVELGAFPMEKSFDMICIARKPETKPSRLRKAWHRHWHRRFSNTLPSSPAGKSPHAGR